MPPAPPPDRDATTLTVPAGRAGPVALILVGVVLVALNLRAAVTSLGALLAEVSVGVGMSGALAGVATMLPPLSFAVAGSTTPWLARRLTPARILVLAMLLLAAGQAARALASSALVFLICSALALSGIAVANVLLPGLVKQYFPDRIGLATGAYTMTMIFGTSAAAALSVPVAQAAGSWRVGLGGWAVLAVLAAVPWLPAAVRRTGGLLPRYQVAAAPVEPGAVSWEPGAGVAGHRAAGSRAAGSRAAGSRAAGSQGVGHRAARAGRIRPARTGLGWAMAIYFGLQSLGAYALMGWLAQLFRDAGYPPATAGLLLAAVTAIGVPVAFLMPSLAARIHDLRLLILGLSAASVVAYLGLALAPAGGALLWVVLIAVGQASFPLVLTLLGLRARTPGGTVALSAFAQSTGYLVAGLGPLLVGVLYGATGGWTVPLGLMILVIVGQSLAGLVVARPRYIEDQ
jgi:CP family cyanate transporter-like MFS transporter